MLSHGDKEKIIMIIQEIKNNSLMGKMIGQGAELTGKILGS